MWTTFLNDHMFKYHGPHRLTHSNAGFPVDRTIWEGLGEVALEEMYH